MNLKRHVSKSICFCICQYPTPMGCGRFGEVIVTLGKSGYTDNWDSNLNMCCMPFQLNAMGKCLLYVFLRLISPMIFLSSVPSEWILCTDQYRSSPHSQPSYADMRTHVVDWLYRVSRPVFVLSLHERSDVSQLKLHLLL